jgi:tetratricopeptide (TPR) repeat protein
VKILGMQVRWAPSAKDRKKILFRVAELQEKSLGDVDAAVATLRSVLEIDPQERAAIDALDHIFEAGSQHRQRVEMMRKRIDLAGDATARQELWRQVAGLLERDVGDVDEAIAACVSILDENPQDDQALETLARLYEQQGRHRQRLEILERRLALKGARDTDRVVLLRAIASLLEGPLGDPGEALGRWCEVLEAASGDKEAIAALERFMAPSTDGGLRLSAAQALEPIYERSGRYAELAAVVRVYVDAQTDARARLEQLMRLASLEETPLGDKEASRATTGAGDPRRPVGARAVRAARHVRTADRPRAGQRGRGAVPRDQPRRARRGGQAAPGPDDRRGRAARRRRGDGGRLPPARAGSRPEDEDALEALEGSTARRRRRGAVRDPGPARRAGGGDAKAERELRLQIGALAESPLGGSTRRSPPSSACSEISARRSRRGAGARSPLHQGRALGRSDAPARGSAQARRAARARSGRHPLPDGADRARSPERSRAALEHLRLVLAAIPTTRARSRCWRDARRHRRAGQAAELLEPVYAAAPTGRR